VNEERRNKKQLGQYYTPREVAEALTDWAILGSDTTVLDPSFGGCAFLYAALQVFQQRGVDQAGRQVYGVDVDPEARAYLGSLLGAGGTADQFVSADFFEIRPNDLEGAPFGAVIGNPPYVRHHAIDGAAHEKAVASLAEVGLKIPGRASYWAFFVLHSLRFLRPNGRLAMVLPGSFLHADYAVPVREHLVKNFERVIAVLLQERIFDDAEEETVILLAEGHRQPHEEVRVGSADSANDLGQILKTLTRATRKLEHSDRDGRWLRALLDATTLSLFDGISEGYHVVRLGEWAIPRIGVVTGNNRFFIISKQEQKSKGIPDKHVRSILTRATQLQGLCIRAADVQRIVESGKDALLVSPPAIGPLPEELERYLSEGKKNGASDSYKCRSRTPWYVVPNKFVPAAFMQYMATAWPRVVLNYSKATCTNAIHRLMWVQHRPKADLQRLALGSLSTLAQLSAELVGRSYGGGVLKLEPSEASLLVVPVNTHVDVDRLFRDVDALLRRGQMKLATELVDSAFLVEGMGLSSSEIDQLRLARDKLLNRRIKRKAKGAAS
jgi:adenine-specific DNA-methyltransferase